MDNKMTFSRKKYPTVKLYFRKICEIKLHVMYLGNTMIESIAKAIIIKFDNYWKVVNDMLSVAPISDPQRKFKCVFLYFDFLCEETAKELPLIIYIFIMFVYET